MVGHARNDVKIKDMISWTLCVYPLCIIAAEITRYLCIPNQPNQLYIPTSTPKYYPLLVKTRPTHWAATGHNSTAESGSGGCKVEEEEGGKKAKQNKPNKPKFFLTSNETTKQPTNTAFQLVLDNAHLTLNLLCSRFLRTVFLFSWRCELLGDKTLW